MRKEVLVLSLLLIPFVSAEAELTKPYCTQEGVIGFTLNPIVEFGTSDLSLSQVLLDEGNNGEYVEIPGQWSRETISYIEGRSERDADFVSDEAVIKTEGVHRISVRYEIDGDRFTASELIGCKGTTFSCSLFDMKVESCESNNGSFYGKFSAKGLNSYLEYDNVPQYTLDDVTILLVTDKQYCDKKGTCARSAGVPVDAELIDLGDGSYEVEWPKYRSTVKSMSIRFEPGQSCLREDKDYEIKVNDFLNCDPDPYVEPFVCNGCEIGEVCIPEGTTVVQEGAQLYCKDKELRQQKSIGSICAFGNECKSGFCYEGRCQEEFLRSCPQGNLLEECKCGNTNVRDFDGKFCCDGSIRDQACNIEIGETPVEKVTCPPGQYVDDGICVDNKSEGFFDRVFTFLKGLFSRK